MGISSLSLGGRPSWLTHINVQRLRHHIYRIVIDDGFLVLLSTWIHHVMITDYLKPIFLSLQKQWRMDSFNILKQLIVTHNSIPRTTGSNSVRTLRIQLNQLNHTTTMLHEYYAVTCSNHSISYRLIYTVLSSCFTMMLETIQMSSIGDVFAFVVSGYLEQKPKANPLHIILFTLLKSIISFHMYDMIMYIFNYLLRGWIVSRSTTQREKLLGKYIMSKEYINQMVCYEFGIDHNRREGTLFSETFYSNYVTFISDRLIDIFNCLEPLTKEKHTNEKETSDEIKEKKIATSYIELYESMKQTFQLCLQTLEYIGQWIIQHSNGIQLIEEKVYVELNRIIDTIEVTTNQLVNKYWENHPQTNRQIANQIIKSLNKSIKMSNGTEEKPLVTESELIEKLSQLINELKLHCTRLKIIFKDGEQGYAIELQMPFLRSEYQVDSIINTILQLPIRLLSVITSDLIVRQGMGMIQLSTAETTITSGNISNTG
jgi:hypothetical protein